MTEPSGPAGSNQFIDQEEWLNNCQFGYACAWAEMGITDGLNGGGNTEVYFDGGKQGNGAIVNNLYGYVASGDYGNYESQQMNSYLSGSVYEAMCTPSVCYQPYYLSLSMSPGSYAFGSELYGNGNGSSAVTTYQHEGFYSSSNGGFVWQQAQPGISISWPEQFSIITRPANGNNGGVFQASCGC